MGCTTSIFLKLIYCCSDSLVQFLPYDGKNFNTHAPCRPLTKYHATQLKRTRWLDTIKMASVCLSNSNSLIFFYLISCSPSFYNIICTVNSQWLILKTVIQNDKHKIMKRSAKQYMHWKLFHHLRQKSTVSLSLWQENHAMIPFSMACSLSHLITLKNFFFFFQSVGPIICSEIQATTN